MKAKASHKIKRQTANLKQSQLAAKGQHFIFLLILSSVVLSAL